MKKKFKTTCGGQALIEGILMRGPTTQAIVIRKPDGDLEIQEKPIKLAKERNKLWGVPFLRGPVTFIDSMVAGMRALMFSAEFFPEEEEEEPTKLELWIEKKYGSQGLTTFITYLAVLFGLGLSITLFFIIPTFLGSLTTYFTPSELVRNLAESTAKLIIFLGYLYLCSKLKDIQRVFQYHGAEHKAIFCYEEGLPLTLENVRKQPRHHPRCGTSFMFFVIFISIIISTIVYSLYPVPHFAMRLAANLAMLPLVVSLSYEFNRFMGRQDSKLCSLLIAPGLWLQNFTTFEPDDSMIEVAITALERVIPQREGADTW